MTLLEVLRQPWPWYVAGPLIGLTVPLLLLIGNKQFGVSSNFRHVCAMLPSKLKGKSDFFSYDWRSYSWSLMFALGLFLGGFLGGVVLSNPDSLQLAAATEADLLALGIEPEGSYVPTALFSWTSIFSLRGFIVLVLGGFLVGFGTRYAGGCTSGHAITGLSQLQVPSLVAVIGFFAGGLVMTHFFFPLLFRGGL